MNFINIIKKYPKSSDKIFYYAIIFWPIIFTITEFLTFPSVLTTMIIAILGLGFLYNFDFNRFRKILIIFSVVFFIQLLFIILGCGPDNKMLVKLSEWAKFSIRWSELLIVIYIFTVDKYLKELMELFKKNIKLIYIYSLIILIIEIIYLVLPSGYENVWDGSYFKAYLYSPHVNSYFLACPTITFLGCYYTFDNLIKKIVSLIGVCTLLILNMLTGARAPSIIVFAIVGLVVIRELLRHKKLIKYVLTLIVIVPILLQLIGIVDFTQIPLIEKSLDVLNSDSGFLNGRNYIWNSQFKYVISNFGILNYLFGIGLAQSMSINLMYISSELWAHNDLIETFIGGGLISVTIYVLIFVNYFRKRVCDILLGLLVVMLLFFNGLFVYSSFGTFIPIMSIVLRIIFEKKEI